MELLSDQGRDLMRRIFDLAQCQLALIAVSKRMASFVYRCPNTGWRVHGFVTDDPSDGDYTFEPVTCTACTRVHLVNPATGKVLGMDDDD